MSTENPSSAPADTAARSNDGAARALVRVAVFAALIAVLSILPGVPVGPVPITLQTLGVLLCGMLLGPRLGTLAVLLYLLLLAIGLPVGSGMRGGLGLFVGPTGGFLIGFAVSALLVGLLSRPAVRGLAAGRIGPGRAAAGLAVAGVLGGMVPSYALGVPVLQLVTGLPWPQALVSGMVLFLPGDLIKVALAVLITIGVVRALPNAFSR